MKQTDHSKSAPGVVVEQIPLHHYPIVQSQETGAQFITPGVWGDFVSAILNASITIDARRAARQQQETDERTRQPANVSAQHNANA